MPHPANGVARMSDGGQQTSSRAAMLAERSRKLFEDSHAFEATVRQKQQAAALYAAAAAASPAHVANNGGGAVNGGFASNGFGNGTMLRGHGVKRPRQGVLLCVDSLECAVSHKRLCQQIYDDHARQ